MKDILRQSQHEKIVEQLENGEKSSGRGKNQEISLTRPGDTRWGSHHITILRLFSMWSSVLEVLEGIKKEGILSDQRSMAMSLMDKMETFEFVFIMHLLRNIMRINSELSLALQRKDQDIVNAMSLVRVVKTQLQDLREIRWDEFLEEVKTFCETNAIVVPNMEDIVPTRSSRRGGQTIIYWHHFRVEVFCQVIDLISQEMDNRFNETNTELLLCIACLDPRNSFKAFDHTKLYCLAQFYSNDFSAIELILLRDQLQTYIQDIRSNDDFSEIQDIGGLAMKMVESGKNIVFPLVYRLIELALVLPVATATVKRVFSAMKIIKTDLQNRMGDKWINDSIVEKCRNGSFDHLSRVY